MKVRNSIQRFSIRQAAAMFVLAACSIAAVAQDTSATTFRHGAPSFATEVRNAEVVYVQGNDLVLKLDNGKVEHLVVPANEKFVIDGNPVTVKGLTAGTKLTQSITAKTMPRYVNTVRTIKGKVWHVNVPYSSLIVALPDGTHTSFRVPDNTAFNIINHHGLHTTLPGLKKGMEFEATIITDDTETVIARDKSTVGAAPAPATPRITDVLLFQLPPA